MGSLQETPPPKFSSVRLVDVFVTMVFLWERVIGPLPKPPLFSARLGTVHGRVTYYITSHLISDLHGLACIVQCTDIPESSLWRL